MRLTLLLTMLLLSISPVRKCHSMVVYCTNCSDVFTQALDRITNIQQLTQLYQQVDQAIQQTQQQITMVQQGMDRYANMVRNTNNLPDQIRSKMQGSFGQLSSLTQALNVNRGDASALSQVFRGIYKTRGDIGDMLKTPPDKPMTEEERAASEAAFLKMREEIENKAEQAQEAAFQESGSQISEIEQKAAELDSQLNDLLLTPDGQMKALEAGNQIATLQLRESQRLRQLLAVSIQSTVQKDMKDEKTKQMEDEAWKASLSTDRLERRSTTKENF